MRGTEHLEPAQIRARQEKSFASLIRQVLRSNEFYREKYIEVGIRIDRPVGLSDLPRLPLTLASEVREDREAHPPFGTNLTFPRARYTRVHDGWLDTPESWSWWLDCWAEVYHAAGVTDEDTVFVSCPSGRCIGSYAAIEAGQRLPTLTATADGAWTDDPLEVLRSCGTTVVVATPEDASRLLAAIEDGYVRDACPDRWIVHSRGLDPDVGALSSMLENGWEARCFPVTVGHEHGVWGFGCEHGSLHVNEAEFVVEVVDPRDGQRVPPDDDGVQCGELVLTNLGRTGCPVIRFATGLTVEMSPGTCACGRHTRLLHGGAEIVERPYQEPDSARSVGM
jgi:phenylacetate-CoA ligase